MEQKDVKGEVFGKERSMNVVRVADVDKESWARLSVVKVIRSIKGRPNACPG